MLFGCFKKGNSIFLYLSPVSSQIIAFLTGHSVTRYVRSHAPLIPLTCSAALRFTTLASLARSIHAYMHLFYIQFTILTSYHVANSLDCHRPVALIFDSVFGQVCKRLSGFIHSASLVLSGSKNCFIFYHIEYNDEI